MATLGNVSSTPLSELTPRQTAKRLGVAVSVVRRWIASGRLPSRKISLPDGQTLVLVPTAAPRPERILKDPLK